MQNKEKPLEFAEQYIMTMQRYLVADVMPYPSAYELGCLAKETGLSLSNIIEIYQQGISTSLTHCVNPENCIQHTKRSAYFLGESLRPFQELYQQSSHHTPQKKCIQEIVSKDELQLKVYQREEQLQASLKQKEALLKEIHHRVKNNLQIVSALLGLQAHSISNPEIIKLFKESQQRIYSMALIHEKLYRSDDLSQISINEYIQELIHYLSQSYDFNSEQIKFKVIAEPILLNIETAIPCGLIINELVTNTVKHAFPIQKQGKVILKCQKVDEHKIMLMVKDNGIGISKNIDIETAQSLGLKIVSILTEQLEGKLEIERNGGTIFRIFFSELKYIKRI